mgnify:CR=1 FL=1
MICNTSKITFNIVTLLFLVLTQSRKRWLYFSWCYHNIQSDYLNPYWKSALFSYNKPTGTSRTSLFSLFFTRLRVRCNPRKPIDCVSGQGDKLPCPQQVYGLFIAIHMCAVDDCHLTLVKFCFNLQRDLVTYAKRFEGG